MARAAEEAGFDSIWLGDHLLYRDTRGERGPWDVWTQLAALAAITDRVRLGPLVAATAFHPPGILARMAASVDEVSAGRLVLGIGSGWNDVEFRAFGFPLDHRVSRFEEAFEIVRRLLAGEQVTFAGKFFAVEDAVVLPPPRGASRSCSARTRRGCSRSASRTWTCGTPGTRTTETPSTASRSTTHTSPRRPSAQAATRRESSGARACSCGSRAGRTRVPRRRRRWSPTRWPSICARSARPAPTRRSWS